MVRLASHTVRLVPPASGSSARITTTDTRYAGMIRTTRERRWCPAAGAGRSPAAAAACPRHSRNPLSAKNTATAMSKRPHSRPLMPVECPVWNATWVMTTPIAAQARRPSTAGRKPTAPPTRGSVRLIFEAPMDTQYRL